MFRIVRSWFHCLRVVIALDLVAVVRVVRVIVLLRVPSRLVVLLSNPRARHVLIVEVFALVAVSRFHAAPV